MKSPMDCAVCLAARSRVQPASAVVGTLACVKIDAARVLDSLCAEHRAMVDRIALGKTQEPS